MPAARAAAVVLALALGAGASPGAAAAGENQLVRVKGSVQFQLPRDDSWQPLFGRIDLPDDALAVTLARSEAALRLPDSSEIDIGARARVRVGAFNQAEGGPPTVVGVELGAVHFVIRHPAGARARYRFVTSTSQIAVRGTEGYIVAGPTGTDVYCVACAPGDMTVTVGGRSYALRTGMQAIVTGTSGSSARTSVITEPCGNPAAIELSGGKLGRTLPAAKKIDTTGALGADPLQPRGTPLVR